MRHVKFRFWNDLIAVKGDVFRAIQVKTTQSSIFSLNRLPSLFHVVALAQLVGEGHAIHLDQSRIFLLEKNPRQNVQLLSPALWTRVDEPTRQQFGVRYAKFLANNDQDQQRLARQFLEIVGAVSYIPDSIRGAEIESAVQDLLTAHRNFNNFRRGYSF